MLALSGAAIAEPPFGLARININGLGSHLVHTLKCSLRHLQNESA